ncbi:S4A8 protein, partial [Galbula dea]|nr:S4A8 protein [Galbula dea]
ELDLMKKIPAEAEASNVLVGELDFLPQPIVAFFRLAPAVILPGMTEVPIPTRFLFVLLGPEGKAQEYHEIGRCMATIMMDEVFQEVAYKAKNKADIVAGIDKFLDEVTVLPPGQWDSSIRIEPPPNIPSRQKRKMSEALDDSASPRELGRHSGPELEWTGRPFGGFMQDVKRKAPWFWSDFWDGLSLQCVASFLFLYCACMSPVITFGGLLGEATDGHISAMESLLGASLTGMVYSLFAGQPLTILGSTGPVLVFEKIVYKFCKRLAVVVHGKCISHLQLGHCSQFPQGRHSSESLACLSTLCCVLVSQGPHTFLSLPAGVHWAVDCLLLHHAGFLTAHPLPLCPDALFLQECRYFHGDFQGPACGHNGPYTPNVFFWCCILLFSTFVLSNLLKKFRNSRYFPAKVQSTICDFAVFLSVVFMVLLDFLVGIPSPKLHIPHMFKPTRDDRGWFINPIGPNPWWTVLAALIPALLSTILLFMDQQITVAIVNRKEHKLK